MLKIRNLRKAYGGYHALNGLDMEIADGALYGFVGLTEREKPQQSGL